MTLHRPSSRRGFRLGLRLPLSVALLLGGAAHAATFTVSNTSDSGAGSLRAAIEAANATATPDDIEFAIAGAGTRVIRPATPLPTITQPVLIDGYTQPGAAANTLVEGGNAVIRVRIDGSAIGDIPGGHAFSICAPNTTIRGFSFTNFARDDVAVGFDDSGAGCTAGTGGAIEGNYFGFLPDGRTPAGVGDVIVGTSDQATIGGTTPAQRNVFGGETRAINLVGAGSTVIGNYIGTDASGQLDFGGAFNAILVTAAADGSTIGTVAAPNLIANHRIGIFIAGAAIGVEVFANRFVGTDLGIELSPSGNDSDGVTANDPDDNDTGGNNLQNFPQNISVSRAPTGLTIAGRIDRTATAGSLTFTVAVYANASCGAPTVRSGEQLLGTFEFTSASPAAETFTNVTLATDAALPVLSGIVLTATDAAGNTSELSDCFVLDGGAPTLTVNKTVDTNDGACNSDCSLREAIVAANAQPGGNVIAFAIPGVGVQTITLGSNLPTITAPVLIDGYTQPGAAPNSSATASNAAIRVRVNGAAIAPPAFGFSICSDDVWIRGLSITNFATIAVMPGRQATDVACPVDPRNTRITGNFIGLAPDGTTAAGNGTAVRLNSSDDAVIGGAAPAERNVISGNNLGLVWNGSRRARALGNLIGTTAAGTGARGNSVAAFLLAGVGCGGFGLGAANAPNLVAFNGTGVLGTSASDCPFYANDYQDQQELGIDLVVAGVVPDGVTPNDPNDVDAGPNNLQNFPVLTRAAVAGGTLTLTGSLDVEILRVGTYRIAAYESVACDASGNGEGQIFLGYADAVVTGSAQGFSVQLQAAPAIGSTLTTTVTDSAGNTSEHSACVTVVDGDAVFANGFE